MVSRTLSEMERAPTGELQAAESPRQRRIREGYAREDSRCKQILRDESTEEGLYFEKENSFYIKEERNILARVKHPFIVNLYYAFQSETKLYLVMEYCSGGELFRKVQSEGLIMEDTAIFYIASIVLAVEYLHSVDIVHRDLKPENVLLDNEDSCASPILASQSLWNKATARKQYAVPIVHGARDAGGQRIRKVSRLRSVGHHV